MRMRELAWNFLSSNSGQVALTLGLCAFPMFLMAGSALDYMRAHHAEALLQAAVDTAALAGGASPKADEAAVKQMVSDYLAQNGAGEITGSIDEVKVERPDDRTFRVTTEGRIRTTLMNIAGIETMHIGAMSEVTRGYGQLEVALVLDNTGSMDGAKLQSLKDSAHLMVKELFSGDSGKGVKMALVPFSRYVNVGMSRRHEAWMDVPKDQTKSEKICRWEQINKTNCRWETCTSTKDGKPFTYSCEKCEGEWKQQCSYQNVEYKWHGCVGSRDYPLNVKDTQLATPYPGILKANCASEIMPLTADERRIEREIDAMTATGKTYIPGGLIWGWNAVSSAEPLSEGAEESDDKVKKAVVLMTDGENTLSPTYPEHNGGDKALANSLSLELCSNIKEAKIKLFTVSFEVTDATTEEMLKSCASSPKDYYNADDPEHLKKAFDAIATALAELRISQ